MEVRTEEEQKKLLAALLLIARSVEQEAYPAYQSVMRLQMGAIRDLVAAMEGEGSFRVYQWQEALPYIENALYPVVEAIADTLPARLSLSEPIVQDRMAKFLKIEPPVPTIRSAAAMSIKAVSGERTLSEMLGMDGQDSRLVKRYVTNIDRVVKIGLLTDRPTKDIADDVFKPVRRNGRDTLTITRGTVANQNLNITNNMVREVTWDIIQQNILQMANEKGVVKWVWNAILDPDTCPVCRPKDGETEDSPEDFGVVPPIHPNCRCAILPLRFE